MPDAPLAVAVAVPFEPPLQDTLVPVALTARVQEILLTTPLPVAVQPLASVTVTA